MRLWIAFWLPPGSIFAPFWTPFAPQNAPQDAQERSRGAPASDPERPRRPAGQVRGALVSKMGAQIALGIDFY